LIIGSFESTLAQENQKSGNEDEIDDFELENPSMFKSRIFNNSINEAIPE
jgi:hypothetical protein